MDLPRPSPKKNAPCLLVFIKRMYTSKPVNHTQTRVVAALEFRVLSAQYTTLFDF